MKSFSGLFAALADESRLRLLHLIKDGEVCVCHLQEALQTNQPKISRHLAYLKRAGLVEVRREGKWMHYQLRPLAAGPEAILRETLKRLQKEPQVKKDTHRLKKQCC